MPLDVEPAMDRQRMREIGRRLADGYFKHPPLLASNPTSEPAASHGFAGEGALEIGRNFATNFPSGH
jgi:hypothetical protein